MALFRPEPALYDIDGWRQLVAELRAATGPGASPSYLDYAISHLAAIEGPPGKTPVQAS